MGLRGRKGRRRPERRWESRELFFFMFTCKQRMCLNAPAAPHPLFAHHLVGGHAGGPLPCQHLIVRCHLFYVDP